MPDGYTQAGSVLPQPHAQNCRITLATSVGLFEKRTDLRRQSFTAGSTVLQRHAAQPPCLMYRLIFRARQHAAENSVHQRCSSTARHVIATEGASKWTVRRHLESLAILQTQGSQSVADDDSQISALFKSCTDTTSIAPAAVIDRQGARSSKGGYAPNACNMLKQRAQRHRQGQLQVCPQGWCICVEGTRAQTGAVANRSSRTMVELQRAQVLRRGLGK